MTRRRTTRVVPAGRAAVGLAVLAEPVRVVPSVRRDEPSPLVRRLLEHLAAVGFDGVPRVVAALDGRPVAVDPDGRRAGRPLPGFAAGPGALAGVARLLRRYHDAAASLRLDQHIRSAAVAGHRAGSRSERLGEPGDGAELVGHGGVGPEAVLFRDVAGVPVPCALVGFDLARPMTRLADVVAALERWAPLAAPADRDPVLRGVDVGARLRLFCDAYGLDAQRRRMLLAAARDHLLAPVDAYGDGGPADRSTIGRSTAGRSTAGRSTAGRSTAGRSAAGRSAAGRGSAALERGRRALAWFDEARPRLDVHLR